MSEAKQGFWYRGSAWVAAFLSAVPLGALLGGALGWLVLGADLEGSAAGAASRVEHASVAPAAGLLGGASALAWNTFVGSAGALAGALSGLLVAPLGVLAGRRLHDRRAGRAPRTARPEALPVDPQR